jgi:hypothetical protein
LKDIKSSLQMHATECMYELCHKVGQTNRRWWLAEVYLIMPPWMVPLWICDHGWHCTYPLSTAACDRQQDRVTSSHISVVSQVTVTKHVEWMRTRWIMRALRHRFCVLSF